MLKSLLAVGLTVGTLITATPTWCAPSRAMVPPPDRITVRLITANGTGCRPGTTVVAPFLDNTGFTVTYSAYTAQDGDHITPVESRKNCQLGVQALVPQGYTYAISQVTYRGYLQLARGSVAMQQASYYFAGDPRTSHAQRMFSGEFANNWTVNHEIHSLVWAPCRTVRNININSELRVHSNNPHSPISFMTMDSTDASWSTVYRFSWRRC
jgi:hypothetical protein